MFTVTFERHGMVLSFTCSAKDLHENLGAILKAGGSILYTSKR